jgi:hypothetical protein
MLIRNKKDASKLARKLEKRDARRGLITSHSDALGDIAELAETSGWNALAVQLKPERVDSLLQPHELRHIAHSGDNTYGKENSILVHTGFEICYDAEEETPSYVRVRDPLGREVAYWTSDEWREDPELVMGALLGALARGAPLNVKVPKSKRQPSKLPRTSVRKAGPCLYRVTLMATDSPLGQWTGMANGESEAVRKATDDVWDPRLDSGGATLSWKVEQPEDDEVGPFTVVINGGEYTRVDSSRKATQVAEMLFDSAEGAVIVLIEGENGETLLTLARDHGYVNENRDSNYPAYRKGRLQVSLDYLGEGCTGDDEHFLWVDFDLVDEFGLIEGDQHFGTLCYAVPLSSDLDTRKEFVKTACETFAGHVKDGNGASLRSLSVALIEFAESGDSSSALRVLSGQRTSTIARNWAKALSAQGKQASDLDELVHEAACHLGGADVNTEESSEDEQEAVLNEHSQSAANVNNEGIQAQLEYLISFYGEAEARLVLEKELKITLSVR